MSVRKTYVSSEQKQLLIELIETNPNLVKQKFTNNFTHKDLLKAWEDVSVSLNSCAGAKKDGKEWKKVNTVCLYNLLDNVVQHQCFSF